MIPAKVKEALDRLGIKNVEGGFATKAAKTYTCWDKDGKLVIVLAKLPGGEYCPKK